MSLSGDGGVELFRDEFVKDPAGAEINQ